MVQQILGHTDPKGNDAICSSVIESTAGSGQQCIGVGEDDSDDEPAGQGSLAMDRKEARSAGWPRDLN